MRAVHRQQASLNAPAGRGPRVVARYRGLAHRWCRRWTVGILFPEKRFVASTWSRLRLLSLALLAACGAAGDERLATLVLETGEPLIASGPTLSVRVAVLVDPATCLTCDEEMNRWIRAIRAGVPNTSLAFDRHPTPGERKLLTLARMPPALVLRAPSRLSLPRIVFVEPNGELRSIALAESGDLLRRIAATSLPSSAR